VAPPPEAAPLPKAPAAPEPKPAPAAEVGPPAAAPVATPHAEPPRLNAPFCAQGGDEKVMIRFTLGRALAEEAARGGPESAALLPYLQQKRPLGELYLQAQQAAARAPCQPWLQAALALTAEAAGETEAQLSALRRLRTLLPKEPGVDWALVTALRESADLDEPIEALDRYLAVDPVPGLQRLRARLSVQRELQHDYHRSTRGGLTLLWAPEAITAAQAEALLSTIDQSLDGAAQLAGTPRRRRLTVVVYPGRSELLAVSCVQSWAGGLYDGTLRLVASTDPRLGVRPQALVHEALHAQLSPAAGRAPLWFHEGLAQSFAGEVPEALPLWRLMVKNKSWIPFESLSGSFQVFDSSEDARLAYAQSLALVELLREQGGEGAVAEALRAFQEGESTQGALRRALRRPELTGEELLAFIEGRLARK
jgi:tetratricopeptide (TPR) repeat protein